MCYGAQRVIIVEETMEYTPWMHWRVRSRDKSIEHEKYNQTMTVRLPASACVKLRTMGKFKKCQFMRCAILEALQQES